MLKTELSASGPLAQTQKNMDIFCTNMLYSSACNYTWQAYALLEKANSTPQNDADMKFYLETLFTRPLEENV
jgi:hypothetical protein